MSGSVWLNSILSGLAGGVLASIVTIIYAHRLEKKRERQARTANSLSLISALEAFAINCSDYVETVIEEIHTYFHTNDSSRLSKLPTPIFTVPSNVDFRPIDTGLASKVLTLPFLIDRSNQMAYNAFVYGTLVDATEESMKQFGIRGLAAWELASSLRSKAGLPKPQFDEDWNFLEVLRKAASPAPSEPTPAPLV
tara:strand:+ start:1233 stop:1817 length:585 start_codon:yes stop_codon:yes gene_type:complete